MIKFNIFIGFFAIISGIANLYVGLSDAPDKNINYLAILQIFIAFFSNQRICKTKAYCKK
ncbi:hypothetical protein [Cellvibrio japonicus]|uniref:hypothetical protein n=1 Tax=Cellvibrio japonicus TaxID=155077 RepID=UPI0005A079DC|nr:hypothetical protein [Cellvibrio japonicus]QEI11247.1 hypothetical protein FY117_02690 [Cellvibrio japonicus]QEI14821.1 hypothetical protein FY116_02690 [Cellvibrio japonicus]QEI18401.1 hypothetical protein FY115_02690 [Cellvibrio japonicus]